MYEFFGAGVVGNIVTFRLFFPDSAADPNQYKRGGDPKIKSIRVRGDFQSKLGGVDWDLATSLKLTKKAHPKGSLYTAKIPNLPDGFYEYKYFVEFQNGDTRWCNDPCAKYGGSQNENSAFVVGGSPFSISTVEKIAKRLPIQDLVIYELMLDDFTKEYLNNRAPLDALLDKIDYLKDLGINAVEFMPWTAWLGDDFSWGYNPYAF